MILGIVGLNASGKGEVVGLLAAGGFEAFSLSDEIRFELRARGVEACRDAMIEEGRRLRREFGYDILARRVAARFTRGLNQVVDSVRNPEEVRFLRTLEGFFLVAVEAPAEMRFERARARGRPGDHVDLASFEEAERRELASSDPAAQQLIETMEMADIAIVNDGDVDLLRVRVRAAFREAAARSSRPSWDEYFMKIAEVVSERSNCVKRKVAAVVVRDRRVISTGYNGTPAGTLNCSEGGCERCMSLSASGTGLADCLCSHAEENAIVQAALHGVSLKGATLYSTFSPCLLCAKMIINSGIAEVVFRLAYPVAGSVPLTAPDRDLPGVVARLFHSAGVVVRKA